MCVLVERQSVSSASVSPPSSSSRCGLCQPCWSVTRPPSLTGHKQAEARTAAPGEEEAPGGEAPAQSPGEQEQPQGQQQKRSGAGRAGHLGEDLRCSQHLTLAAWEPGDTKARWSARRAVRSGRPLPKRNATHRITLGVPFLQAASFSFRVLSVMCFI